MSGGSAEKDTQIIRSLDKGLFLLEVIQQAGKPIALKELWQELGWDKATIHRLLHTLVRRGYLLRDSATKQYTLGLKIFGLYDSLVRNFDIQPVTRPYLEEISEQTGEAGHLAVLLGKDIVFIDRVASRETLSVNTQIGAHEPAYCTALGRAVLGFIDEETLAEHLPKSLERYTTRTVTSVGELRRILHKARSKGYALDDEEYIDGIRCAAAPVFDHAGYPIAAIGISGPKIRMPMKKAHQYGELIRKAGLQISRHIGYHAA